MKVLLYGKRENMTGYVCNRVENGSIGQLLDLAKMASVIFICNKTRAVVLWLAQETVYFEYPTEVTFTRVETELLKPYSKMYNGQLSVGREDDENMLCTPAQTILTEYAKRLKGK